jgi:hypothetical protein
LLFAYLLVSLVIVAQLTDAGEGGGSHQQRMELLQFGGGIQAGGVNAHRNIQHRGNSNTTSQLLVSRGLGVEEVLSLREHALQELALALEGSAGGEQLVVGPVAAAGVVGLAHQVEDIHGLLCQHFGESEFLGSVALHICQHFMQTHIKKGCYTETDRATVPLTGKSGEVAEDGAGLGHLDIAVHEEGDLAEGQRLLEGGVLQVGDLLLDLDASLLGQGQRGVVSCLDGPARINQQRSRPSKCITGIETKTQTSTSWGSQSCWNQGKALTKK